MLLMTRPRESVSTESIAFNPFAPPEVRTSSTVRLKIWIAYQPIAAFILGLVAGGVGLAVTCGTLLYVGFCVLGVFSVWTVPLVAIASTVSVAVGVLLFAKVAYFINTRMPRPSKWNAETPAHMIQAPESAEGF